MRKYKTIQVKQKTHELLQTYCNERGYKMSWLVDQMIKERIRPKNVLRVK